MDKDQKLFIAHCREVFQEAYGQMRIQVMRRYNEGYANEPIEYKKHNAGIRAGNLYLLSELKKVGAEKWRPEKEVKQKEKPKPAPPARQATGQKVSSGVKPMKPLPPGMTGIQL